MTTIEQERQLEADLLRIDDMAECQRRHISYEQLQTERGAGQGETQLQRLVRLKVLTPAEARAREAATDSLEKLQSLFGSKSSAKLANELALREPTEFRRLKHLAIKAGILPQTGGRR